MFLNIADVKDTLKRGTLFWRRVALPLLIALLALGYVRVSPVAAVPPLHFVPRRFPVNGRTLLPR